MVGFDLGTLGFKVAQLKRRFGRYFIIGQAQTTLKSGLISRNGLTEPEVFSRLVSETFRQTKPQPITDRRLTAALPESFIYAKNVTLPTGSIPEAKKTLQYTLEFEAAEIFPISPEDAYIDYIVSGTSPSTTNILVVAAPKAIVDSFSQIIVKSGFELTAIQTKALALARLFLNPKRKESVVLCDIGAKVTKLSIFHQGQLILAVTTAIGAIDLRKNPTNFKRLGGEISKTIDFYRDKYGDARWQAERIIISGGGAHVPKVNSKITKIVGIRSEIGQPIVTIDSYDPQFAVAYGLSLASQL